MPVVAKKKRRYANYSEEHALAAEILSNEDFVRGISARNSKDFKSVLRWN